VTPTWYDVLGVAPEAPADEIRAAWKAGIADLDPGDRRFRSLNEAAEVLLDPQRRAAYDATLAPGTEGATRPAPPSTETEADVEPPDEAHAARDARTTAGLSVPAWLLAALAVLTALALAAAGYLWTQPSDAAIADATSDAQGAAERATTTILAYDYRHLDQDQQAADDLMTPAYQKKYDQLFSQIAANAPDLKAIVTAEVIASGIVRSGDDRVQVLVFVNRPTVRSDKTEPEIFRDQVVMTMVKQDGDWLVDNMDTNQLAG
jgi:Mce-associated membrane protein